MGSLFGRSVRYLATYAGSEACAVEAVRWACLLAIGSVILAKEPPFSPPLSAEGCESMDYMLQQEYPVRGPAGLLIGPPECSAGRTTLKVLGLPTVSQERGKGEVDEH